MPKAEGGSARVVCPNCQTQFFGVPSFSQRCPSCNTNFESPFNIVEQLSQTRMENIPDDDEHAERRTED